MNRTEAEQKLNQIFKLTSFYSEQWTTVDKILRGERVLLIHRTGFGKSLCYQFPATQFDGITVIFSPLIALMRDQVSYLKGLGISAECINSEQSSDENMAILDRASQNKIKILYIAPERQENIEWIETVRNFKLSLIVIDEAHCISVWGHDFRPAFKRIVDLVKLLPIHFPVLAVTATATEKVAEDITKQLKSDDISYIRGCLLRDNFKIQVVRVDREEDKLGGILDFIKNLSGTGFIYTGTRVNTDIYANFLISQGIKAIAYSAGLEGETRKEIELKLKNNEYKCVVSTNALGMGIDKKDVRFIIHTQFPQSPIHYYQEIGRAGRDGKNTDIILFYNPSDRELPDHFINTARPARNQYEKVIDALKHSQEPLGERSLVKKSNLKQTRVRVIKADLIEQGIIKEVVYGKRKKYEYQFNAPDLDFSSFEKLRKFRCAELDKMIEYIEGGTCRMKYLRNYLGDKTDISCGKCDTCLNKKVFWKNSPELELEVKKFYDNYFPALNIASEKLKLINGVAASYYGFSSIGTVIHKCKYERGGYFPDSLLKQALRAYRKYFQDIKFDLVVFVPPTESKDLVGNFAERISVVLKIPISHNLCKAKETKPQKVFQNSWNKKENVDEAFDYKNPEEIEGKNILLIDDIFDSGATIKEIAETLAQYKINLLAPLVIAKTIGNMGDTASVLSLDTPRENAPEESTIQQNRATKVRIYTVEDKRKQDANAYKPWTDEDDKKLIELHNAGMNVKDLSECFKRNKGAVRSRLKKLI
ncbi:MAG: RecQ family ATP-dependent DNA helicase [Candidatus Omnitrophica bacterium]|nr:RecQ family ATP-dependent DNA helicase [Candidatus Omnitrophota bacterium]MCG2714530.1 RecQ family ATP-dependent DNA helicase [Candidatus Omnitrophota bacterium]